MTKFAYTFLFMMVSSQTLAATNEVTSCAEDLSDDAKLILQVVKPKLLVGGEPRDTMKSTVTELVLSGQIARSSARSNAQAVGNCLKMAAPE